MTRKNLNRIIFAAIVAFCFLLGGILMAFGATVWTQSAGYFNWYKVTTANRYLPTTEIDVPASWIKQTGTYIQCKSAGGANRYYAQGFDCYGKQVAVVQGCDAFVCADDFGLTIDLTKNTVLECPRVKITKEQIAQFYEGKLAGIPSCR